MNKKHVQVAVGVIENKGGDILIAKRGGNQHLAGLWEFPGGKIENGESADSALERELYEEIGIHIQSAQFIFDVPFEYAEKKVTLHIFLVRKFTGDAHGNEGQKIKWVAKSELDQFEFPEANKPILVYLSQLDT